MFDWQVIVVACVLLLAGAYVAGAAGYAFLRWRSQSGTRLPVIKPVVIARAKG